ncbi:MAG: RNA polymerase factor sigma-32 [Bdellovibrionales bacterium]
MANKKASVPKKSKVDKGSKSTPKSVTATLVDEETDESPRFEPEPLETDDVPQNDNVDIKTLVPLTEKGLVSRDPLITYLNEIRRYSLLTKEQEFEIAKRYFETKDPQAAQELIKANLRFVVKVAAEYSKFGTKMIDLIQEGNVGLMHAVKEYNPYKGARLITYAVWWIRGYIQEYLMKQFSMVKIGTTPNQRKLFYQLQKQKEELERMGQAGVQALSQKLGIPVDEIEVMQSRLNFRDVSLDKPLDMDSDLTLKDVQRGSLETPIDEKMAVNEMISLLKEKIEEIRPLLNEKEKIILEERLLNDEPLTLQEIGEKYGITREAVRQAEVRLMKKIRERMGVGESDSV